jgi:YcxB-like protein
MEEIRVDVRINVGDMFHFFMYHAYSRVSGLFSIFFGLAMFVLMIYTYGQVSEGQSFLYFMFGLFFLVFNPINFYARAYKLVKKTPAFQEPISYVFTGEGITTKQKEESATVKWEDVQKVANSKRSIIIYVSKVRANIIPKQAIGDNYTNLVQIIKKNVEPSKVKIK